MNSVTVTITISASHIHKSSSIPYSSPHVTAIQQRSMDTVVAGTSRSSTVFTCAAYSASNGTILEKCGISGIEAIPLRNQFRWCGHVYRMSNTTTKQLLYMYGQLPGVKRHAGGQHKRYKDQLRVNFKSCNLDHTKCEALAEDRSAWREECYNAVNGFEEQRIVTAKACRTARKDLCHSASSTSATFTSVTCRRTCSSRISLFSHQRSHR